MPKPSWQLLYTETARKELLKLPSSVQHRIKDYVEKRLLVAPHPKTLGKPLKGGLRDFWRFRVGEYRLICDIDAQILTILVLRLSHRKEVYRKDL